MTDKPVIANLDFDTVKQDLISHFKSRTEFSDYEFTGSSLNLLMDILSYNTHYYSLASNFLLSESFLDSAILRKNVVSLAKRLNYTPRSISSAYTTLRCSVTKTQPLGTNEIVVLPAGTLFTASSGNQTVTFYTMDDYVVQFETTDGLALVKTVDVTVYEGRYTTQRFVSSVNYDTFSKFTLNQTNIDTTTIVVSVNGVQYEKILPENENLFDTDSSSLIYFLEENRNGGTDVIFGDGIAGKALSYGDEILVTYLLSSGDGGNGIISFSTSNTNITAIVVTAATQGGAAKETIQSIKDNSPKWFQAQYRAVTTNDYEAILKNKFADIQAISVYGGEEVGYPGKVFICIKPKSGDTLSTATKAVLKSEILSNSNVVTVRPEFVDPQIYKLSLSTVVVFDKSRLSSSREILKTKVKTLFDYINTNYIGDFLDSFRESNLSYEIKNLDTSVISSNTRVRISADVTTSSQKLDQYKYSFNNKIYHPFDGFVTETGSVFSSSAFYRVGKSYQSGFDDDGYGNIRLFDVIDDTKVYVNRKAGSIDYENGIIEFLYDFDPVDTTFTITVIPESVDVLAVQDMILEIDAATSTVDVVEINETGLLKSINLSRSF